MKTFELTFLLRFESETPDLCEFVEYDQMLAEVYAALDKLQKRRGSLKDFNCSEMREINYRKELDHGRDPNSQAIR